MATDHSTRAKRARKGPASRRKRRQEAAPRLAGSAWEGAEAACHEALRQAHAHWRALYQNSVRYGGIDERALARAAHTERALLAMRVALARQDDGWLENPQNVTPARYLEQFREERLERWNAALRDEGEADFVPEVLDMGYGGEPLREVGLSGEVGHVKHGQARSLAAMRSTVAQRLVHREPASVIAGSLVSVAQSVFGARCRSQGIDPFDLPSTVLASIEARIEEVYTRVERLVAAREERRRKGRETDADRSPIDMNDDAQEIVVAGLKAMGLKTRGFFDSERQRAKRAR